MRLLLALFWLLALSAGMYLGIYAFLEWHLFKALLAAVLVVVSYTQLTKQT